MNGNEPPTGPDRPGGPPGQPPSSGSPAGPSAEPEGDPRYHTGPDARAATRGQAPYREHIRSRATWLRLVFMLIFVVIYAVAEIVASAVVITQFLWVLLTGERNEKLREFGQSLAGYAYEIVRYLTFNSERRPFPFDADWPSGVPREDQSAP